MIFSGTEYYFLLASLLILAAAWIMLLRHHRLAAIAEKQYVRRLRESQSRLQDYIADLDNLVYLLAGIHEFGMMALGIVSADELARFVVNSACKLTYADSGSLMLIDNETGDLTRVAATGAASTAGQTILRHGEGVAGRVAQTGKPMLVDNMATDARFIAVPAESPHSSPSFICVPLRVKNRTIGVLTVDAPSQGIAFRPFEEKDLRLLTILADQAAVTLDNIALYDNLQNFYLDMVQTLARAIDAKDAYTHDHADRARRFARMIALKLSLPEQMVRHIEYAALMHDIGKIGISEAILHKAGRLTDDEMTVIRRHPSIGNKIIAPVAFLAPVAPMVLYHQEWYDGRGYPEGLRGEEIPLGARIVAVIDAYDAMTSDRPYRKALPREVAIAELHKGAGGQFDPRVVEAFLQIISEEGSAAPLTS